MIDPKSPIMRIISIKLKLVKFPVIGVNSCLGIHWFFSIKKKMSISIPIKKYAKLIITEDVLSNNAECLRIKMIIENLTSINKMY